MRSCKVFLGSSNELAEERGALKALLDDMDVILGDSKDPCELQLIRWEELSQFVGKTGK